MLSPLRKTMKKPNLHAVLLCLMLVCFLGGCGLVNSEGSGDDSGGDNRASMVQVDAHTA